MSALESRLGIFAHTFVEQSPAAVFAQMSAAGYTIAHWDFAAIGKDTIGADVNEDDIAAVRAAADEAGVHVPILSLIYNMAHPDTDEREAETARAARMIRLAPLLGVRIVELCTGSRDRSSMWRKHPENRSPEAWADFRRSLDALLPVAADAGVTLGIEPEPGNIVVNAHVAAELLANIGRDAPLGIVFDAANFLQADSLEDQQRILTESADLLGDRVIDAHAKDINASGFTAPGAGGMDYPFFLQLLHRFPHAPLIVQNVTPETAAATRSWLIGLDESGG